MCMLSYVGIGSLADNKLAVLLGEIDVANGTGVVKYNMRCRTWYVIANLGCPLTGKMMRAWKESVLTS